MTRHSTIVLILIEIGRRMSKYFITLQPNIIDWSEQLMSRKDEIKNFLLENISHFPKPKQVRHNDWSSHQEAMQSKLNLVAHPMYGKCFHSAKFAFYFGGGKQYFDLMLMKPFMFDKRIPELLTTHWFVKSKKTDQIVDPSEDQFRQHDWVSFFYKRSNHNKRGEFGNPYFGKKNKVAFSEVVPSNTVFHLAELWKKEKGEEITPIEQWRAIRDMCTTT